MARKSSLKTLDTNALERYMKKDPAAADEPEKGKTAAVQTDAEPKYGQGQNPKSQENLHPRKKGRTPTLFMQLNIYEFEDYLNTMSKDEGIPRTKYIQKLIRKDMEERKERYELLKKLEETK